MRGAVFQTVSLAGNWIDLPQFSCPGDGASLTVEEIRVIPTPSNRGSGFPDDVTIQFVNRGRAAFIVLSEEDAEKLAQALKPEGVKA